jgi:serine-type D-Ala-D-Ala carboxypeptidase/endopeptidase
MLLNKFSKSKKRLESKKSSELSSKQSPTNRISNWRFFDPGQQLLNKFEPGTRYSYSGEGINLLQFVLEQITGENLEASAQEKVFQSLGMKHTSYIWQAGFDSSICYGHNTKGEPYGAHKKKVGVLPAP